MTSEHMSIADICLGAADLIMEEGWVQGRFVGNKETGPGYCMAGAVWKVLHKDEPEWTIVNDEVIGIVFGDLYLRTQFEMVSEAVSHYLGTPMSYYNDGKDRSVEDVLLVFKQVAAERA